MRNDECGKTRLAVDPKGHFSGDHYSASTGEVTRFIDRGFECGSDSEAVI